MKDPDGGFPGPEKAAVPEEERARHRLLLALLSVDVESAVVEDFLSEVGDWPEFLTLCRRHRVMSLVAKRLSGARQLPPEVMDTLRQERSVGLTLALRQVMEARRLVAELRDRGIASAVLKGAPLAIRAYGDLAARDARDIDLLVEPRALSSALAVLKGAGLKLEKPKLRGRWAQVFYLRYSHEYVLKAPTALTVEVKARLHPTRRLMPGRVSELLEQCVNETVGGTELPALAPDTELLYLCCHGARHSWFRLKWLVDIAFLIHGMSAGRLARAIDVAHQGGVEVPLLEALMMAHDWLGAAVSDDIVDRARSHPLVQRRQRMILAVVLERSVDVLRKPPVGHDVERSEYLLRGDWSYRRAVFERHVMVRLHGLFKGVRATL